MNCEELLDPATLSEKLNRNDELLQKQIEQCLYKLYFEKFKFFALKKILRLCNVEESDKLEIINFAFGVGITVVIKLVKKNGFKIDPVTGKNYFETFFFKICKLTLKNLKRKECPDSNWIFLDDNNYELPDFDNAGEPDSDDEKDWEVKFKLFDVAMEKLDPRCRRYIQVGKLIKGNRKQNIENKILLADEMGIGVGTVDNEVYRCFNRLKDIIDDLIANTMEKLDERCKTCIKTYRLNRRNIRLAEIVSKPKNTMGNELRTCFNKLKQQIIEDLI